VILTRWLSARFNGDIMSIFHYNIRFSKAARIQSKFLRHIEALSSSRWNEHAVFQRYQISNIQSLKVMQFLEVFSAWLCGDIKKHPEQTENDLTARAKAFIEKEYPSLNLSPMEIHELLRQMWKAYPYYSVLRTYSECVDAMGGYAQTREKREVRRKENQKKSTPSVKKTTRRRRLTKFNRTQKQEKE
jgi:hypothetical protein